MGREGIEPPMLFGNWVTASCSQPISASDPSFDSFDDSVPDERPPRNKKERATVRHLRIERSASSLSESSGPPARHDAREKAATRIAETSRRIALPLSYGPTELGRQDSNLRPIRYVVPTAFAAEPPPGVAPGSRLLQGSAPALGGGKGRAASARQLRDAPGLPGHRFCFWITPTKCSDPSSPLAKREIRSNTASEKPPTFSTSARSATCVEA